MQVRRHVRSIGARLLLLGALLLAGLTIAPAPADAWQIFYANYTTFGGYNHWQYAGGSGTKYGVIPMYNSVWSTGETANVNGNIWLKVYWNGNWGWSVHLLQGYDWSFSYQGVTSTPWTGNTAPANGSSTNSRRPAIRWDYGDPDGGASSGANIQIASDAGFGSLIRSGGCGLGGYDPDWDMAPGQYWWRAQTYSWINGWGGWSGATWFIVRHPTRTLINAPQTNPTYGSAVPLNVTVEKYLDGSARGAASSMAVTLQQSTNGTTWSTVSTGNTNSSGAIQFSATPTQMTYYRASCTDSQWNSGSSSGQVQVTPQKKPTALTIAASNSGPRAGDSITISGRLSDSTGGVSGATVQLQRSSDGAAWISAGSATCDSSGQFSLTHTPSGVTLYRVLYAGDSTRASSTSGLVSVTPVLRVTSLSLTVSSTTPRAGDSISINGRLSESTGGVSGATVQLQRSSDGAAWISAGSATCDGSGQFSLTLTPSGVTLYRVLYAGDSTRASSTSGLVSVTPLLRGTSVSLSVSSTTPRAGDPVTVSGRLLGEGSGLGGALKVQTSRDNSTWTDAGSGAADSSGSYSLSVSPRGATYVRVIYAGDSLYGAASSASQYIVPVLRAASATLGSSSTSPRVVPASR